MLKGRNQALYLQHFLTDTDAVNYTVVLPLYGFCSTHSNL